MIEMLFIEKYVSSRLIYYLNNKKYINVKYQMHLLTYEEPLRLACNRQWTMAMKAYHISN